MEAWIAWNRLQETDGWDNLELDSVREESPNLVINWIDFNLREETSTP